MRGSFGPDLSSLGRVRTRMQALQRTLEGTDKSGQSSKGCFVDVLASAGLNVGTPSPESVSLAAEGTSAGEALPTEEGEIFDAIIRRKARQYDVDEALVRSVIRMESGGDPRAVSKAGAMGVMQLMPGTAEMLGVEDPFDAEQNIDGGIRYLKSMLGRYSGDETKALAAYHSGPGNVDRYGGVPPHPAVNHYVKCVLSMAKREREGR